MINMLPLVLIIPAVLTILEKVLGPLVNKTGLIAGLSNIDLSKGFVGGIMSVVESVMGNLKDDKKLELQMELESLRGQLQLNFIDAQSETFFKYGARLVIFWGLGINLVVHYTVVNCIDIVNSVFDKDIGQIPPFDNMALIIISGLLGLYMAARSIDKYNVTKDV